MFRRAVFCAALLGLIATEVQAGKSSASFTAGIVIGGQNGRKFRKPAATYTWGAAAISLLRAGFENPARMSKSGTLYWFEASRGGTDFRIAVSIASGKIIKVIPA